MRKRLRNTTKIDRHTYRRIGKLKGDRKTTEVEVRRKVHEGRCMNRRTRGLQARG